MSDLNIGKKVRQIRLQKGMSAKFLAAQAEITPSMLTQIEKGQSNPSINTIKQVAQALDTPLYTFFMDDDNSDPLVVRKENRRKLSFEFMPEIQYERLTPDGAAMEFCKMTLVKHKASSTKMFSHNNEELSIVTQGTVVVVMNGAEYELNEGDSIRIPAHTEHRWENRTDDYVEVVYVIGNIGI